MQYKAPSPAAVGITALAAIVAAAALALGKPIEMRVDGQPVLTDVAPVRTDAETVFVPLRPVSDALGAETHYDQKTGEITLTHGDQTLRMKIGDLHASLNGMPMTLRHAPFRVRGRAMISLRAVQRAFGVRVTFDKSRSRVDVNTLGTAASAP